MAGLQLGHRAEGGQHLAGGRRAGAVSGRPALARQLVEAGRVETAARQERFDRVGVHGRVLADLQGRHVEAERLHLPDQVLEVAESESFRVRLPQRGLDRSQVLEEFGRVRIAMGKPGPGGRQALGGEQQELPVRLPGRPLADRLGALRHRRLGASQGSLEPGRRPGRLLGEGQRAADPPGGVLEPAEDVLGVDVHRRPGHLVVDVRIAVAITAHPASPGDQRQVRRPLRRLESRSGQRPTELAVEGRDEEEEGLVEDRADGSNLVQRGWPVAAELGGAPEDADLLGQPPLGLGALRRRETRVAEPLRLGVDPAQRVDDGPAAGLGRMRGEHGADLEPSEQLEQPLGPDARLELGQPWSPAIRRLRSAGGSGGEGSAPAAAPRQGSRAGSRR